MGVAQLTGPDGDPKVILPRGYGAVVRRRVIAQGIEGAIEVEDELFVSRLLELEEAA